jgi:hypothetical protein
VAEYTHNAAFYGRFWDGLVWPTMSALLVFCHLIPLFTLYRKCCWRFDVMKIEQIEAIPLQCLFKTRLKFAMDFCKTRRALCVRELNSASRNWVGGRKIMAPPSEAAHERTIFLHPKVHRSLSQVMRAAVRCSPAWDLPQEGLKARANTTWTSGSPRCVTLKLELLRYKCSIRDSGRQTWLSLDLAHQ